MMRGWGDGMRKGDRNFLFLLSFQPLKVQINHPLAAMQQWRCSSASYHPTSETGRLAVSLLAIPAFSQNKDSEAASGSSFDTKVMVCYLSNEKYYHQSSILHRKCVLLHVKSCPGIKTKTVVLQVVCFLNTAPSQLNHKSKTLSSANPLPKESQTASCK